MQHAPDCRVRRVIYQYTEQDQAVGYAMCDRLQALLSETAIHTYNIRVGHNGYSGTRWYAEVDFCELDKEAVGKALDIANKVRTVVDMPAELRRVDGHAG